jgi:serine/threonine protein kinase
MINNGLITTRSVDEFKKLEKLGEGTYGVVYKAQDRRSGRTFALKRLIMHNERKDGFPLTSLREIGILAQCRSHRHCVMLEGIATSTSAGVSSADSEAADTGCRGAGFSNVFLVFEYCEHDLSQLLRRTTEHQQQPLQSGKVGRGGFGGGQVFCPLFSEAQTKTVLRQLLSAVAFLHARNVVHRDIKPSNVLYTNKGACLFLYACMCACPLHVMVAYCLLLIHADTC